jgi:hypothetical protein
MGITTERHPRTRIGTACAMRAFFVMGASLLATPATALDATPAEFAANPRVASDARVPDALGVAPLPEGGGLVMLTSGVAAISLMRRRRRAARKARAARDGANASDRVTGVAARENGSTATQGSDRGIDDDVASGLLA